jgi:two-component system sensor histidine kinase CpxA
MDLAHEFDRMAAEIETLRNEQHRLLADISHELRSPLTRLAISTELASRGDEEALERMRKDITALDSLIEQILTLTRLEIQEQTRSQSSVALEKLLAGLVDDADFEAREQGKGVTLEVKCGCSVRGQAGLLRSSVENVVRNAIRYTPVATAVRVLLEKREDKALAVVTVQDSGRGVPEEMLGRIFEPFYRVAVEGEEPPGTESGGSGLGLSISERIVRLYGGGIHAHNAKQGGLVVVIELPLAG